MSKQFYFLAFFFFYSFVNAQVGVNTTTPEASSILDIVSTDKGVLIPRVSLTGTTDNTTITSPLTSLLVYNQASVSDVIPGYYYWNGSAWTRLLNGTLSGVNWTTSGNTVSGTEYIGTLNNFPFNINVNGNQRFSFTAIGQLVPINTNSSIMIGDASNGLAADAISIGSSSIASGVNSIGIGLSSNAYGSNSLSIGFSTEAANSALALGDNANSYGENGVAIGLNSLANTNSISIGNLANSGGQTSISIGNSATTGASDFAVAIGNSASASNSASVGIGTGANASGSNATAVGNNATATPNFAASSFGYSADATNARATAIGSDAQATGANSTAIGNAANASADNSTALGNGATISTANRIRIGNTAITNIEGQVTFVATSDKRFKYDVKENVPGLQFITKLKPVTYKFDRETLSKFRKEPYLATNTGLTETGFLAQDVEEVANRIGFNFNAIDKPKNISTNNYSLSYSLFVVPLVKAVQEQQMQIESLQKEVAELKKMQQEFAELKMMVSKLSESKKNTINTLVIE